MRKKIAYLVSDAAAPARWLFRFSQDRPGWGGVNLAAGLAHDAFQDVSFWILPAK